jgi:hypothetical protein
MELPEGAVQSCGVVKLRQWIGVVLRKVEGMVQVAVCKLQRINLIMNRLDVGAEATLDAIEFVHRFPTYNRFQWMDISVSPRPVTFG